MSLSLVAKRTGRRRIRWGRLLRRVPLVGLLSAMVFLATTILLVPLAGSLVEIWWAEHVLALGLGSVALGLVPGIAVPLVRGLRQPVETLPDLAAEPEEVDPDSLAAWLHTWRYLFGALGLLILVGLLYAQENWRGRQLWESYERRLASQGKLVNPASLIPPLVPEEENFALTPFLAPLFGMGPMRRYSTSTNGPLTAWNITARLDSAGRTLKPSKAVRSNSWVYVRTDLRTWYAGFLNEAQPLPARAKEVGSTNVPLAEAATGVLAALSDYDSAFDELRAASRLPHSRFPLNYEEEDPMSMLLPHLAAVKGICRVLQLRASAELALGRTDAALDDVTLLFRMADSIRDEPILISHLVRLAGFNLALVPVAEGLAEHRWSEPQLRALQDRLQQFDFWGDSQRALQGERVLFGGHAIDLLCRAKNRSRVLASLGFGNGGGSSSGFDLQGAIVGATPTGWFYLEKLSNDRLFQECLLDPFDAPPGCRIRPGSLRQAEQRVAAVGETPWPKRLIRHQFFAALLLPALGHVLERTAFTQTAADTAATACALERYRLARGEFPPALDSLVPQFMDRLPSDIINGQPLRYRREPNGQYVLYSVGWNEIDEGGQLGLNDSKESVDRQRGDWVWRLPGGS